MTDNLYDNPLNFVTTLNVGIPGPAGAAGDPEAIAALTGRIDVVTDSVADLTDRVFDLEQNGGGTGGGGEGSVPAHEAAPNPHPQYLLRDEVGEGTAVLSVQGRTGAVVLTKTDLGLGNVSNTTDAAKPISTATQAALDTKATVASVSTLTAGMADKVARTELAPVAFSGDYGQLTAKPVIPTTPQQIGAEPIGAASAAIASHASATDPHPQYTTALETQQSLDAWAVSHTTAVDPHPQYTTAQEAAGAAPVQTVQGRTGAVLITKADLGLSNVENLASAALRDRSTHTGTQPVSSVAGLLEYIRSTVVDFLDPGANVTLTHDVAADSLVIAAASGEGGSVGTDPEGVRDVIADALQGIGAITVVPNDPGNVISISTSATVNSSDAALRDRTTHTGVQPLATITGLQAALDARPLLTSLAPVALSGSYGDLANAPVIPTTPQQVGADPVNTAATLLASHEAAIDPHPNYTTVAEAAAAAPVRSVNTRTGAVVITKADVGLGSVDNVAAASLRDRTTHTGTQPASTIGDSTATGRAVLTATDATAARTAIGAGTSNLALGTTASTAAAGNDARLSDTRVPTDGSVSAVKIADNAVVNRTITDGAVTDAKVSAANKDGAATTPSMRTLGTGALQALPGSHATDADPHTQYLTAARGDARYTPAGGALSTPSTSYVNQGAAPAAATDGVRVFSVDVGGVSSLRSIAPGGIVSDVHADNTIVVRNQTGAVIPKGTVVYQSGVSTSTYGIPALRLPLVSAARADAAATALVLGVTMEPISHNFNGRVLTHGFLGGLNTGSIAVGGRAWLSSLTAGAITGVRPSPPVVEAAVGVVVRSDSTDGLLFVAPAGPLEKGIANGLASLAGDGKVPLTQLPTILTAQDAANASPVQSVAGRAGNVVLSKTDVGLANVDNTTDAAKPISTATQTALNAKAATTDTRFTDTRVPTDASVTNVKVATGAAISLDKTADSATRLAMTAAERTKVASVATGATANATDAALRDRATHTGTQAAATISDFTTAVEAQVSTVSAGAVRSIDGTRDPIYSMFSDQQVPVLPDGTLIIVKYREAVTA